MQELYDEARQEYEEENNTEESYEDFIDEISGEIQIGSFTYSAGRTLREIDPIAFRCGMSERSDEFYERFDDENCIEDFREEALEKLDMENDGERKN